MSFILLLMTNLAYSGIPTTLPRSSQIRAKILPDPRRYPPIEATRCRWSVFLCRGGCNPLRPVHDSRAPSTDRTRGRKANKRQSGANAPNCCQRSGACAPTSLTKKSHDADEECVKSKKKAVTCVTTFSFYLFKPRG